jgi:hypothetical protein
MWRDRIIDTDFSGFLLANPVHLAVVIATAGQIAAVILV